MHGHPALVFYTLYVTTAFRHALRGETVNDAIFLETPACAFAGGRGGPFLHITARNNCSHSPSVELRLADVVSVLSVYSGCGNSL